MVTKRLLHAAMAALFFHTLIAGAQRAFMVDNPIVGTSFLLPYNPGNVVGVGGSLSYNGNFGPMSLLEDGSVFAWYGESLPGWVFDVVAVTGGHTHCMALKREGVVFQWGTIEPQFGRGGQLPRLPFPAGLSAVVAIAAGESHSLALKNDGTVVAWGSIADEQCAVPAGLSNVVAITAGLWNSYALKSDGTVVTWGYWASGTTWVGVGDWLPGTISLPGPKVLAILKPCTMWGDSTFLLRADGSAISYNAYYSGNQTIQTNPFPNVAGMVVPHVVLTSDGRMFWDGNILATNVNSLVSSYAWGGLGMLGDSKPAIAVPPYNQLPIAPVTFNVIAVSPTPATYQWRRDGSDIPDATNNSLVITDAAEIAAASEYAVVVANEFGSVTSKPATLWPKPIPWLIPIPPGTYIGLFQATNDVDFETSGYFQLRLTTRYAFSGFVLNQGVKYPFTGQFGHDNAHLEIPRTGLPALLIDLHINHDIGVESITGTVSDGNWTAELLSERSFDSSLFSPDAGNYTLVLPPEDEDPAETEGQLLTANETLLNDNPNPKGNSCGTLSVRANGKMNFVGKLSDYTTACQGVSVSRKGRWPLYAKLYKGAGAIQGWVTFTNTASASLAGDVRWFKTAPYGRYYPAGFTNRLDVVGSRYVPGVPLNASQGVIVLSGGDLVSPLTKQVVLNANKVFDAAAPSARQLITINAKSGAFTGSILADPVKALRVPVKGVVLQQQINGAGFSLGMTNTGSIYLEGQ